MELITLICFWEVGNGQFPLYRRQEFLSKLHDLDGFTFIETSQWPQPLVYSDPSCTHSGFSREFWPSAALQFTGIAWKCMAGGPWFGNVFYWWEMTSNFWSRSKAKQINLKSFFKSLVHFRTQFRVKENFKLLFAIQVEKIWRYKSHNSLANKKALNFSGPCRRVRPAKLTNHSAYTNLEIY